MKYVHSFITTHQYQCVGSIYHILLLNNEVQYSDYSCYASTVDVKKFLQNHSQNIISIVFHQISKHELVTSVEDYNVLMLTSCRFVDKQT